MSGARRVRSMNVAESEARPVLGPAGNKVRPAPSAQKLVRKVVEEKKKKDVTQVGSPPISPSLSAPAALRRQELLLHSNLSLNASCSSDASTDSFCSRASTGRIGCPTSTSRWRQSLPKPEKIAAKLEKIVQDGPRVSLPELSQGVKRCAWVTPNTDPCYVAFHDEEWGVQVHDDRKLFELLVLSGALAEHTWPTILSKRHTFREVFMEFDPVSVSKLSEKKLVAAGSTASSLLSEPKLRAIVENARQIVKIIEEFGSFDKYCWSFVNNKPVTSRFRYPRQVPVKTPKADVISKDLVKRGFRCVGPTVIYSFMQVAGLTNDHLISCYRFNECATTAAATSDNATCKDVNGSAKANRVVDERSITCEETKAIDLEFSSAVDSLCIL